MTKKILIKHVNFNEEVRGEILTYEPYKSSPDRQGIHVKVKINYESGNPEVVSVQDKSNGDCKYTFKLERNKTITLDAVQLFNLRILLKLMDSIDTQNEDVAIYEYKELK